MNIIPSTLGSKPGIQRDGTAYRSDYYIDGQNVRFYRGWPEKMLGSEGILQGTAEVVGSTRAFPGSQSHDVYVGRPSSVAYYNITNGGVVTPEKVRTPTSVFTVNPNNLWSFDSFTATAEGEGPITYIVASVSPSLSDITSEANGGVFYGQKNSLSPLTPLTDNGEPIMTSGPVICAFGLIICLGNDGILQYVDAETRTDWKTQTIGSTKLCGALLYQGSLMLWSLDNLYKLSYDSTSGAFTWLALASISIWSANSIVLYKNTIYWIGNGQFFRYAGSLDTIYNVMSSRWFFGKNGVNASYKGKISSYINAANDEWWILYPRGTSATECNFAEIYYPSQDTWNGTPINRGTGLMLSTYGYPLLTSTVLYPKILPGGQVIHTYPIFEHEKGIDEVYAGVTRPLVSYFEYAMKDFFSAQPSTETNICMQSDRFEPDLILEGEIELTIRNRMYAQSPVKISEKRTIYPDTEKIDLAPTQGRLVSVRLESNKIGSYYECGRNIHGITKGSSAA